MITDTVKAISELEHTLQQLRIELKSLSDTDTTRACIHISDYKLRLDRLWLQRRSEQLNATPKAAQKHDATTPNALRVRKHRAKAR